MKVLSPGFMAPIIWGLQNGYTEEEIAAGLLLTTRQVVLLANAHAALTDAAAAFPEADELRAEADLRYRNWAKSQRGARAALRAMGVPGHA